MSDPLDDAQRAQAHLAQLEALSAASEAKRAARVTARYGQVEEALANLPEGEPLRVPLSNSKQFALIDPDDWEKVKYWSWSLSCNGYAQGGPGLMHRAVMGVTHRLDTVDHINRNRLDNRKANLRVVPHAVNCRNKGTTPGRPVNDEHRVARYWAKRAQGRPDPPDPDPHS
jgi:hypothetical protein